jgi:hypothetical protein
MDMVGLLGQWKGLLLNCDSDSLVYKSVKYMAYFIHHTVLFNTNNSFIMLVTPQKSYCACMYVSPWLCMAGD